MISPETDPTYLKSSKMAAMVIYTNSLAPDLKCCWEAIMHRSIPSTSILPPLGKPLGNYLVVVKGPAPGQNFPAKAWLPGQENNYLQGVF